MANVTQGSRANATRFVYVGCKLIHGLTMELFHENTIVRETTNGAPNAAAFKPPVVKASITLKGANSLRNDYTVRALSQPNFEYAVTPVPAEFWEEWIALHKDAPFIKNGFIFALPKEKEAIAEGKTRSSERTGVEPLNPEIEKDLRLPSHSVPPEQRVAVDRERLSHLTTQNGR